MPRAWTSGAVPPARCDCYPCPLTAPVGALVAENARAARLVIECEPGRAGGLRARGLEASLMPVTSTTGG